MCCSDELSCIKVGKEYGTYCSGAWSTGGWAFTSDTNGGDVCASIVKTGGTVQRKGLYKVNGLNRVVARCYPPNYGWVVMYEGIGNGPLTAAYNDAYTPKKPGCVFTVSPTSMPIFDAPFDLTVNYTHATGHDFAKAPYMTLNVSEFGQVGSAKANIVNWKGEDRSKLDAKGNPVTYADGHSGHDWPMPKKTPIKSVADGLVVSARDWDSGVTTSDSPLQKEVSIMHKVCGGSGYYEKFLTYYAHLNSYDVVVGQAVKKGNKIGESGNTGNSGGPHLHFGVIRLTNTADMLEETVHFLDPPDHSDATDKDIEPYGWAAPKGFDPWAWKGYPQGAFSLDLWNSGQKPSTGNW
jgi:murein DD-endopeptidase MepM/ murein hydrolase activator NlpD